MATGISSRPRRNDYSNRSSNAPTKVPGVPSYPLPVSLGASHSSSANSPTTSGVTPGPAPGISRKGSNGRMPPPPSQDPRQYARHFPSLDPALDHASSRNTNCDTGEPSSEREPPRATQNRSDTTNEYERQAEAERWQHTQHHSGNAGYYSNAPHHHTHPPMNHMYPHHPGGYSNEMNPNQQRIAATAPPGWAPYIYPHSYGVPPPDRYHHEGYHPPVTSRTHIVQQKSSSADGRNNMHDRSEAPIYQQQANNESTYQPASSGAEGKYHSNSESGSDDNQQHQLQSCYNDSRNVSYYQYMAPSDGSHPQPSYVVVNTPPSNLEPSQLNYMHPYPTQQQSHMLQQRDHSAHHHSHKDTSPSAVYSNVIPAVGYSQYHERASVSSQRGMYSENTQRGHHRLETSHNHLPRSHNHNNQRADSQGDSGLSSQPTPVGTPPSNDFNTDTITEHSPAIKVRAVISGWKAGTIIGRQGQVISSLRNESQCRITISDDPTSPDRVLTIIGHPTNVSDVLRRVCFMLGTSVSTFQSNRDRRGESSDIRGKGNSESHAAEHAETSYDTNNPEESSPPVNFTLAVPSPLCGCLIGRAGIQIKNFRQTYGVQFSVSSHTILESLDRPVNISGSPANVADCLEEVCRLFAAAPSTGSRKTRTDHSEQKDSTTARHSNQGNDGRHPVSEGRHGGFRSNWRRNLSDADVHHHGGSEEGSVDGEQHRRGYTPTVQPQQQKRRPPQHRRQEDSAGDGGEILGNAIEECSFELSTGETEVHLLVPNDIVGCIIGKGGKTISEIRATSGAIISITESAFPPPMPPNAIGSSYPSTSRRDPSNPSSGKSGGERGLRSRDRVICIRGRSKNIRTARYLMGSSILNAQRGGNGNNSSQSDNTHHHMS